MRDTADPGDLGRRAKDVLDANWLGHATLPSPNLYPHQWSWDSACIAIGYARYDQMRAQQELLSLFGAQWSNGLVPHIVFANSSAPYFPGPDFWQVERSPYAPRSSRTSGIVQPPIHATAAWHIYRHASDRAKAAAFLEELLPRLAAWHAYLYRERTRGDDGLAEIWHPWESGMDNSPLWDDALARLLIGPEDVPDYERIDVKIADAAERPTDDEYDRYAYLVKFFRDRSYQPDRIRQAAPFAVRPVLFNSLLVQANRDLADIARVLGADPGLFEGWADQTAAGLDAVMWDEERGVYVDDDVVAGRRVPTVTPVGFAPLYAGVPTSQRAQRMLQGLLSSAVRVGADGWVVPSLTADDPRFRPTLYWRGPVWPILNWVLYQGLDRYGFAREAEQLRAAMVSLPRDTGFWEHYSATTHEGRGGQQFAWTAALVLDLLHSQPDG